MIGLSLLQCTTGSTGWGKQVLLLHGVIVSQEKRKVLL
jgi:hypothetical protein